MATYYLEPGRLPEGVVPAHTLHGEPADQVGKDYTMMSTMGPVQQAFDDGTPYYEDVRPLTAAERTPRCTKENCNAWAMKDSSYCRWHQDAA